MYLITKILFEGYGNNSKEEVLEAISDIRSQGYPNPFDTREIVIQNKVGIDISFFDGALWVSSITSYEKGGGRLGMQVILNAADKHGVIVRLSPEPFGKKTLNRSQLINWYKRLGFNRSKIQDRYERLPQLKENDDLFKPRRIEDRIAKFNEDEKFMLKNFSPGTKIKVKVEGNFVDGKINAQPNKVGGRWGTRASLFIDGKTYLTPIWYSLKNKFWFTNRKINVMLLQESEDENNLFKPRRIEDRKVEGKKRIESEIKKYPSGTFDNISVVKVYENVPNSREDICYYLIRKNKEETLILLSKRKLITKRDEAHFLGELLDNFDVLYNFIEIIENRGQITFSSGFPEIDNFLKGKEEIIWFY